MKGLAHGSIKPSEQEIKNFIESRLPGFRYKGGYKGSDSSVLLQCRVCGADLYKNMRTIRKPTCSQACPFCEALKREAQKRAEQEARKAEKEALKIQKTIKEPVACKCCGSLFIPSKRYAYCSTECARKVANNHKDSRLKGHTDKDWNITVPALVARDNNICYLCGEQCNSNDYRITDEGYFIAGPTYPSVDHVVPIAKGGKHKWDNVKLAHLICNTKKSDKLPKRTPAI